ncbi:MAG: efflux RND transporter permease subunit [Bacteroidales bacterium]
MHLSELVFRKKKIFYFLLLAIVIGGVFSFRKLSKLEDPEITVMAANVVTVYPGASAHEVELKVTNVLEEELSALADLDRIESRSEANVSIIQVHLSMKFPRRKSPSGGTSSAGSWSSPHPVFRPGRKPRWSSTMWGMCSACFTPWWPTTASLMRR